MMDVWWVVGALLCVWLVAQIVIGLAAPFQSNRRKMMIASWGDQSEASIFGFLEVDVSTTNEYIQKLREQTGHRISITHVAIMALGKTLREIPELNGRLIFKYFFPHKTVDIGCLVSLEDGKDLFNVKLNDVDQKKCDRNLSTTPTSC